MNWVSEYKTDPGLNVSWGHRGNNGDRPGIREKMGQHHPSALDIPAGTAWLYHPAFDKCSS